MKTQHEYRAAVEEMARTATTLLPVDEIIDRVWHEVEFSAWTDEHAADVMRHTKHPNAVFDTFGGGLGGSSTAWQVLHRMAAAAMIEDVLAEAEQILC